MPWSIAGLADHLTIAGLAHEAQGKTPVTQGFVRTPQPTSTPENPCYGIDAFLQSRATELPVTSTVKSTVQAGTDRAPKGVTSELIGRSV